MFSREHLAFEPVPLPNRMAPTDDEMLAQADAYFDQMKRRHTVRDFCERAVPREVIEQCVRVADTAPSGDNHQPWHFAAIASPEFKRRIRLAAEEEKRRFYNGDAGDEWIKALEPIGTDPDKPHLEIAPWLIVVFAQRWGQFDDGTRFKNYYVLESVGIATGFLVSSLHHAGLSALTHTPNPMKFLREMLDRPESEKTVMIIAVGHPADDATVPKVAKIKKPLDEILTVAQ